MKFKCPHCGQKLEAEPEWAGEIIDCPSCSQPITIPAPVKAPPIPAAPQPPVKPKPPAPKPEAPVQKQATPPLPSKPAALPVGPIAKAPPVPATKTTVAPPAQSIVKTPPAPEQASPSSPKKSAAEAPVQKLSEPSKPPEPAPPRQTPSTSEDDKRTRPPFPWSAKWPGVILFALLLGASVYGVQRRHPSPQHADHPPAKSPTVTIIPPTPIPTVAPSTTPTPPLTPASEILPDILVLGDAPSEQKHGLNAEFSETAKGALNQPARRLLPRASPDYYGGEMTFKMTVDPAAQNYFTVKIWGSDKSSARLILNCEGREIGWRHGGTDGEVFWDDAGGWFPERFVYRTAPLPRHLTRGKTSVTIKVRSTGPIAESDASSYEQFQKKMDQPSVGIYRAYTHVGGGLEAANEVQGNAPAPKTPRPASLAEDLVMNQWKADVNKKIGRLLEGNAAQMNEEDLAYLAQCYEVSWSDGYKNGVLVDQVIAGIDAIVTAYGKNHENAGKRWGGSYGPVGEAIRLLYPQLQSQLDAPVNFTGPLGITSRRQGWSAALRMSVEYGRFNRQPGASLAMIAGWNLYLANRGLLLIDPANALQESAALRYLHEAVGLSPWLGNDQPGDSPTPTPGAAPFGPNWFTVTSKGTTKDDAFVGGLFGELGPFAMTMAIVSGDAPLRDQALKMCRARAAFRYPGLDGDGYLVMRSVQPLSCRDERLPGPACYLGRAFYEDFLTASLGAAAIGNDLLGYFQQQISEGQLLPLFEGGNASEPGAPYVPDQYAAIKAMAPTGVKLPMSDGQPDFAWADEENMALAAKHGEERFWAVLNWRNADSINGLAKIFHLTPTVARLAEVQIDDVQFKPSGVVLSRGPQVEDVDFPGIVTPPDRPINANEGLSFPVALRPDLTQAPAQNRDGGRGHGYTLRYGKWLAAINAHPTQPYILPLPKGVTQALDLISGQMKTGPVTVAPKTSVVFYMDAPSSASAAAR